MDEIRRPSMVLGDLARKPTPGVLSLAGGLPADDLLPQETLKQAEMQVVTGSGHQYGWAEGDSTLRKWVADRMNGRGANIQPDDVVITAGAQQALCLVASVWPYGSQVAVDRETYPGAMKALRLFGHELVEGLAPFRYVMNGIATPYGIDNFGPRRQELLASGANLIVDEAYAELRFDGCMPQPAYSDAPDRVFQVGSFSKLVSPGHRVGWLIPPRAYLARILENKGAFDLQTGGRAQDEIACWLEREDYDALASRARQEYHRRAELLLDSLQRWFPTWKPTVPEGGLTVWVETDLCFDDEAAFLEYAERNHRILIQFGSSFCPFQQPSASLQPSTMRLCFSQVQPQQLDEAMQRLAAAVWSYFSSRRG